MYRWALSGLMVAASVAGFASPVWATEPEPTTTTEATTTTTEAPSTTTSSVPSTTTSTEPPPPSSTTTTTAPSEPAAGSWDDMSPADHRAVYAILGLTGGTIVGGALVGRRH